MADTDYSIKDLAKCVKLGGNIKNVEMSRLTSPGENFISLVLKAHFTVEKDGQSKVLSTVAKRLSMGERKNIKFHAIPMRNEIKFYNEIVPLLTDFAEEHNIEDLDFFPEYLGSRFSCDPEKIKKEEADADSFLLLENLIPQGYKNEDRFIGFDLITTQAIVKRLALLHSVPLAMKIKQPDLFKVIKQFFDDCMPKPEDFGPAPPPGTKTPNELILDQMIKMPECSLYADRLKKIQEKPSDMSQWFKPGLEPWSTVLHGDFWVNNIMIKPRKGQEPLVKFVDFQVPKYGSYAKDLAHFLLISVDNDIITNYMDDILWCYYKEFTSVLTKASINLELTFTAFLKELRRVVLETEFQRAIFYTLPVFGEKNTAVDPAVQDCDLMEHMVSMIEKMNQHRKDKLVLITTEAGQRNWL